MKRICIKDMEILQVLRLLYCLCSMCISLGEAETVDDVRRLLDHLFSPSRYNKHVRPVRNQSGPIQITVSLSVYSINDFDMPTGKFGVLGGLYLSWRDELLTWNTSQYGDMSRVSLPSGAPWKPKLKLAQGYDFAEIVDDDSTAWLESDGNISMTVLGLFESFCQVNIFFYPYDSHTCEILFGSDVARSNELVLYNTNSAVDVRDMRENGEWEIVYTETGIAYFVSYYGATHDMFSAKIKLKRLPEFIFLHSVLPVVLLSWLTILVFQVPVNSGERVTFSITLFLTFTVLISSASVDLPRTSKNISLYSIHLVILNCMSTVAVFLSIFVSKISILPQNKPVPEKMKIFCAYVLKLCAFKTPKHQASVVPINDADEITSVADNNNDVEMISGKCATETQFSVQDKPKDVTWVCVADALDVVFFAIYVCTIVAIDVFWALYTSIGSGYFD